VAASQRTRAKFSNFGKPNPVSNPLWKSHE
jgi:hypothetical protein